MDTLAKAPESKINYRFLIITYSKILEYQVQ
jgi:hypothetical protein